MIRPGFCHIDAPTIYLYILYSGVAFLPAAMRRNVNKTVFKADREARVKLL